MVIKLNTCKPWTYNLADLRGRRNIWRGDLVKNVLEFIERSAERYPDKLAVADENGGITYSQLELMARKIGAWIYTMTGGEHRKPVAVLLDKKPESVAAYMGVLYSGNFYVVLDAEMPDARAEAILGTLKPVAIVTDSVHMEQAENMVSSRAGSCSLSGSGIEASCIKSCNLGDSSAEANQAGSCKLSNRGVEVSNTVNGGDTETNQVGSCKLSNRGVEVSNTVNGGDTETNQADSCNLSDSVAESSYTSILNLDDMDGDVPVAVLKDIRRKMIDTDPAYALFTSGSTGVPKGAVVSHANIIAYINWYTETFGIDENTVFGNQTPFYFSMSVSDLYSTLKSGATLYIIPKAYFTFPMKLMEFLATYKINTIYWVPSALQIVANYKMFQYAKLPELKKVLFAGEVMPTRPLNYWIHNLPDAMYANLFGPTETTDICTYYIVDRPFKDDEPLPMGYACDNCDVFVIDSDGCEVSPDVDPETGYSREGELYVRGSFVALGYYGNEEKTRDAFAQNPLNDKYPELVYKTGDLVKYNRYGELVYISRKDYQIKHMGYRIELGEIEAAAGAIDGIRSYACIYDEADDKIVFIYEGRKKDDAELLEAFRSRVPHYMEPGRFVRVTAMPHNANGKIDRKRLKAEYIK